VTTDIESGGRRLWYSTCGHEAAAPTPSCGHRLWPQTPEFRGGERKRAAFALV